MKKILTLVLILLLSYVSSYSQICNWAEKYVGAWSQIFNMTTDDSNNVYVCGFFGDLTLDFNNGVSLSSSGYDQSGYIAKYNNLGLCQWAQLIHGENSDLALGIAVDKSGNVYVTGFYNSPKLNFNNGIFLSKNGTTNSFIAKYNINGICQWAENISGPNSNEAIGLAIDSEANIYITGYFTSSTLNFNNGKSLTKLTAGDYDIYITKYNNSGICQWAEQISGSNADDKSSCVALDKNGNIYISGDFKSASLNFNNNITLTKGNNKDAFITKYNNNGECQWAEKISGDGDDFVVRLVLDAGNNVFVTGQYGSTTLNFNNNKSISRIYSLDGYVAKFNENGLCQWAENISGSKEDYSRGISVDRGGNVYVVGSTNSAGLTFNNNKFLENDGSMVAYFVKYDNWGTCKWVEKIYSLTTRPVYGGGIAFAKSGLIYIAGECAAVNIIFNNDKSIINSERACYIAQYSLLQEPEILTLKPVKITATTAMSGGSLVNDGGSPVLKRGICWSKSENPTINDSVIVNETTGNLFFTDMSGLSPNTEYFVRAFATNNNGTGYGNLEKFKTLIELPSITTKTITNVNYNSAKSGGVIISDGGDSITARGVCWSKNQNPTVADSKTVDSSGSGSFVSFITELSAATIYYVRAYAVNSFGTAYGDEKSFKTNGVIYVNDDAKGKNNGTSWTDAFNLLQSALDGANSGDQILVAEGTYYPTKKAGGINERNKAFQLKKGVGVYGGYSDIDSPINDRNWNINLTILSGDIGVSKDSSDNCYHVFYHPNGSILDTTSILDGFIIKYGNADGLGEYSRGVAVFNFK